MELLLEVALTANKELIRGAVPIMRGEPPPCCSGICICDIGAGWLEGKPPTPPKGVGPGGKSGG